MSELTNLELLVLSLAPFVLGFACSQILQSIRNLRLGRRLTRKALQPIRPQPSRPWIVVAQSQSRRDYHGLN